MMINHVRNKKEYLKILHTIHFHEGLECIHRWFIIVDEE